MLEGLTWIGGDGTLWVLYSPRNLRPVDPVGEPIGGRMGNVPFTASMVSPHEGRGRGKRATGSCLCETEWQPEQSWSELVFETALARYSLVLAE